jgi:hypothetical protein
MSLTVFSLCFAGSVLATSLGAVLLARFDCQNSFTVMRWLGCAYLFGEASVAIPLLAGGSQDETCFVAVNAVGVIAGGTVWNISRVLSRRSGHLPGLFLGVIVWVATGAALKSETSAVRLMIGVAIVAVYLALIAAELYYDWRLRRRDEADRLHVGPILEAIDASLQDVEQEQAKLSIRVEDLLARACVTMGNATDEYLDRDELDRRHQIRFDAEIAQGQRRLQDLDIRIANLRSLKVTALSMLHNDMPSPSRALNRSRPQNLDQVTIS